MEDVGRGEREEEGCRNYEIKRDNYLDLTR
jgi:hypothetical protein